MAVGSGGAVPGGSKQAMLGEALGGDRAVLSRWDVQLGPDTADAWHHGGDVLARCSRAADHERVVVMAIAPGEEEGIGEAAGLPGRGCPCGQCVLLVCTFCNHFLSVCSFCTCYLCAGNAEPRRQGHQRRAQAAPAALQALLIPDRRWHATRCTQRRGCSSRKHADGLCCRVKEGLGGCKEDDLSFAAACVERPLQPMQGVHRPHVWCGTVAVCAQGHRWHGGVGWLAIVALPRLVWSSWTSICLCLLRAKVRPRHEDELLLHQERQQHHGEDHGAGSAALHQDRGQDGAGKPPAGTWRVCIKCMEGMGRFLREFLVS